MKRISTVILYTAIIWAVFYLLSFVWTGDSFGMFGAFFCILVPIGLIWKNINGSIKTNRFDKLQVDYKASIPCYAFLSMYVWTGEKYAEVKKADKLTYAICLCSKSTLYFYECSSSLMSQKEFNYEMCDDIDSELITIPKTDIISFNFHDLNRTSSDRIGNWVANKIAAHIQGYFTNRVQTRVSMDAIVEIYFKHNNSAKALAFGIPESIASPFSIDFFSVLPDVVTQAHGYISDCEEVIHDLSTDETHVRRAKNMIRCFCQAIVKPDAPRLHPVNG